MYIIRITDHYYDAAFHRQEIKNIMEDLGWRGVHNKPSTALILLHDTWIFYSSRDGIIYLNKEELVGSDNTTVPPLPEVKYQRDIKRKTDYQTQDYRYYRSEEIIASAEQERYVLHLVERVKARSLYLASAFSAEAFASFGISIAVMDLLSSTMNTPALPIFCVLWPTMLAACAELTTPSVHSADHCFAERLHEKMDPSIKLTWETLQSPPEISDPHAEVEKNESANCVTWLGSFFSSSKTCSGEIESGPSPTLS